MIALLLAAAAAFDPCTLLTSADIEAVQKQPPKETKASDRPAGDLVAHQCFYTLPNFAQSVAIELRKPVDKAPKNAVREEWNRVTGKERKEEGKQEEEEEQASKPLVVKGVGRGAVWSGNAKVGALYVLVKGAIVRVSVGGAADQAGKIKACTALAKRILAHLPK